MPRNIGRIEADMTLDSRGVARGARDAEQSLDQIGEAADRAQEQAEEFRERLGAVGSTLRTFGLAAGAAAAGVAVVGRQINEIASFGRELSSLSDQVGISVESFQRFRQAFVFAGGEYDEAIETARDFAEAIGLAVQGTGEQARAFERLGFTARDARRFLATDFTEVLREFSEPFSLLSDREQLTLLRDIGISRTEGIQNLLRDTADFDRVLEQVSGIGTISEDATNRLADLANAIFALTEQLRVGFANAVGSASESLQRLVQRGLDILPESARQTSAALSVFANNLENILSALVVAGGLRIGGQAIGAGISGIAAIRGGQVLSNFFGTARQQGGVPFGAAPQTATALTATAAGLSNLVTVVGAVTAGFVALQATIELAREQQRQLLIDQAINVPAPEGVFDTEALEAALEPVVSTLEAERERIEADLEAARRRAITGGFGATSAQVRRLEEDLAAVGTAESELEASAERLREIQADRLLTALRNEETVRQSARLEAEAAAAEAARLEAERQRAAEAAFQARIRDLSLTTAVTTIVPQFTIPAPDLSRFFTTDVINRQFGDLFGGVTGQGFRRFPGRVADETEELTVRFQDLSLIQQGMILSTNELANAFGDLISSITDGVDSLGAAAADFAREFVEVLLNNLILRPLAQNASTLLGGFFGIGQPAQTGAVGGPFGPGLLITGETGREATFMNGRGFTLNPQDTERLLNGRGDTNISVTVNGSVDDPRRFAQEIAREVQIALVNNIDTMQRSVL